MTIGGTGNITFDVGADNVNNVYRSDITNDSFSWDVTNLSPGTLRTLGAVANISGCTYCQFTDRIGFIRNDTDDILWYSRSEVYQGTPTPTLIRTFFLDGDMSDTEGLDGPWWNPDAEQYEYIVSDETTGGYFAYFHEISEADLLGTNDLNPVNIQGLQFGPTPVDNNSGAEGVAFNKYQGLISIAGEGEQASTPRKYYRGVRPTNRTTDYTYLDPEFTVVEPWDPEVEDHMTLYGATGAIADLADVAFHAPSQSLLWLSHTGDRLVQTDLVKNILGTITLSGLFFQPEGICFIGNDVLIAGEANEFAVFEYVAPAP